MSRQVRKPAEQQATKVKNINLLPAVLATDPNKKMLDSTVDLMTSKGQLIPFRETFGLRTASNKTTEFFRQETDPVRKESTGNISLISKSSTDEYLGKASYLDIENYLRVKGCELTDGVLLDKNINVLDLPINSSKLTDYHFYYWVPNTLPYCRLHFTEASGGGNKFSIINDLLYKPFATIVDDLTGRPLTLHTGMVVYFTGFIDTAYKTTDLDNPLLYYVIGVGESINLIAVSSFDRRIPYAYKVKRNWDSDDSLNFPPPINWDSEVWDGSEIIAGEPEYIVQDRYSSNANHWQMTDNWYHISVIRTVATFLNISAGEIAKAQYKATRPIISFFRGTKLYNWPNTQISEVKSLLPGQLSDYTGQVNLQDQYGYTFVNNDRVVFENTSGVYAISNVSTGATFTLIVNSSNLDGVLVTANSSIQFYRCIYKNSKWIFAQNKLSKNQTPLYEFYVSDGTHLESFNETNYRGGIILGYKEGSVTDTVLDIDIEISSIDFDLIDETNSSAISPNQIKFITDIDKEFHYYDSVSGEKLAIVGPYGYRYNSRIVPFYQPRSGLDFTKQIQDLVYEQSETTTWSAEITPPAQGFDRIHIFHDSQSNLKFYFEIQGYGLIRFSSRRGVHIFEQVLPLISGGRVEIVCHDLPFAVTFFRSDLVNNLTRPIAIGSPYVLNNGITNGVIELDLSLTIDPGSGSVYNIIGAEDTRLFIRYGSSTWKTAIVKNINNWNFIQNVFFKDDSNPLYNEYDFTIGDVYDNTGSLSYNSKIIEDSGIRKKLNDKEKICVKSIIEYPIAKTAPLSLTRNPLNEKLSTINYFSIYQHATDVKANSTNIRKYVDPELILTTSSLGGGTLIKHNDPISKFAIMTTNMPFDFGDVIIKQGKHYDLFLNKLKFELANIINSTTLSSLSSLDVLSLAIARIYRSMTNSTGFWRHSNMLGWGEQTGNYVEQLHVISSSSRTCYLWDKLLPIPHRAGKELLTHIIYDNKILLRGQDYDFISEGNYYTAIEFDASLDGNTVKVLQWNKDFDSQIPASLAKIGLAPIYRPEIYLDTTNGYRYLVRHDGTRYYLEDGVDVNNYPSNLVEQYLFEYEKAVFSSIAYDIENNGFTNLITSMPGYFRTKDKLYNAARQTVINEFRKWQLENNIYTMPNTTYDSGDDFTKIYQLGTGDDDSVIIGSWRLIYKFLYDTDRPHSHPWEMMGYTIKPIWWDTHYNWTDSTKRSNLIRALRVGNFTEPTNKLVNPDLSRIRDITVPETFPVDTLGNLLPPTSLSWLPAIELDSDTMWSPGNYGPYEQVFSNTNHGLAAWSRQLFLLNPTQYVNNNWVPGQIKSNAWGQRIDISTGFWNQGTINHYYHRQLVTGQDTDIPLNSEEWGGALVVEGELASGVVSPLFSAEVTPIYTPMEPTILNGYYVDGSVSENVIRDLNVEVSVYTAGIESLMVEFCVLYNKDYATEIISKFNNLVVNKEFLLNGFTNKDNVRIESTSINSQRQTLFVPEESYSVRTVKHYPHKEMFFSGIRIIWDGNEYSLNGFANEYGLFPYFSPSPTSPTATRQIGESSIKEKLYYNTSSINYIPYGASFTNRQEIYDFLIGYGKYLENQGFEFNEVEGSDIRNWQLSAKQFIFWSNDLLAPGNYIDLNPFADVIQLVNQPGQLENLEGTNENVGQIVNRSNRALFGKDLLVSRNDDYITIRPKLKENSIYGIKLTFVVYETVVHLDSTSIFNDNYFVPSQSTSKRSFVIGGKRSQDWSGRYFVPGYVFNGANLLPNYDSMSEVGRNLLDIENVVFDQTILGASRNQFGLNRNSELRQLFLEEDNEILFKNSITYNKGTVQVFNSLNPLTHKDGSSTRAYEEYMVRTGEVGNTKNIEYFEFELYNDDITENNQVIKFISDGDTEVSNRILYVKDSSERWVHKPINVDLRFNTYSGQLAALDKNSPIIEGDTTLIVDNLDQLSKIYDKFVDLWSIPAYSATISYKTNDQVRINGRLYYAITTVSPNTWTNNSDKFTEIGEPSLPNIFVKDYTIKNPDISLTGSGICDPGTWAGTWQVLQTTDRNVAITEICPGIDDTNRARVTCNKEHKLTIGDYVLLINADGDSTSANGIWRVTGLETGNATQFYIDTRIVNNITSGKLFTFKPVRFRNLTELNLATGSSADTYGYSWKKKYNPFTNAKGDTVIPQISTPSGYNNTWPIAIIQDTAQCGYYRVYVVYTQGTSVNKAIAKEDSAIVDPSNIEHLIIYDYAANMTLAKVELYDPKKLYLPQVLKDDIDIIGRVDPARYNRTSDPNKSVYTSLGWYEEFVGRRWWDTSTMIYNDYDHGPDLTKAQYWGTVIENTTADVYEWTKSTVHPSQWQKLVAQGTEVFGETASGTAYVERVQGVDYYHWVEEVDYLNGRNFIVYYFWVKDKNIIPVESKHKRIYSTGQLGNALINPSSIGLPWYAPIGTDAIVVKGIKQYLNNSSTVVQIKKKIKGNDKHHQWVFVSEENTAETIPQWLHVRLRDSIAGQIVYNRTAAYTNYSATEIYSQGSIVKYSGNFYGCKVNMTSPAGSFNLSQWQLLTAVYEMTGSLIGTIDIEVTDPLRVYFKVSKSVPNLVDLHPYNRLGNTVRPYIQSWFMDVLEARRTMIKRLNEIMINIDLISQPNWGLTALNNAMYAIDGETLDMTTFWSYSDYRSEDYDSGIVVGYSVSTLPEMYTLPAVAGSYIRVNSGMTEYTIYEKIADGSYKVVYRKNGTVQFSELLYSNLGYSGWDTAVWDSTRITWDFNLNSVFFVLLNSLRTEIFIGRYQKYYSSIMCTMLRYVLSEQVNVDWLTKSSTIEPINLAGSNLANRDTLTRDEITVLSTFYTSVKSFRDKLRGGTVNKSSEENADFDITETLTITDIT
jgi:hypothetical protein